MIDVEQLTRAFRARIRKKTRFSINEDCDKLCWIIEDMYRRIVAARRGRDNYDIQDIKREVRAVAAWLTNPDGKVGLIMNGTCGNGKTTMLRTINTLLEGVREQPQSYNGFENGFTMMYVSAKDIVSALIEERNSDTYPGPFQKMKDAQILLIDDLGTESAEINIYGNIVNPVTDLLSYRYEYQLMTVITTNMRLSDIAPRYGDRIADRCREMMDKIVYTNATTYRQ